MHNPELWHVHYEYCLHIFVLANKFNDGNKGNKQNVCHSRALLFSECLNLDLSSIIYQNGLIWADSCNAMITLTKLRLAILNILLTGYTVEIQMSDWQLGVFTWLFVKCNHIRRFSCFGFSCCEDVDDMPSVYMRCNKSHMGKVKNAVVWNVWNFCFEALGLTGLEVASATSNGNSGCLGSAPMPTERVAQPP